jgi:hypothetical protein
MNTFSLKDWGATTVKIPRLLVAAAGVATLCAAVYKAPHWLEDWNSVVVGGTLGGAAALLILAIGFAVRGSAYAVERVAIELVFLGTATLAAEVILVARAPENWPDEPLVQRLVERERAAVAAGIDYDPRVRSDVVSALRSRSIDAVPGFLTAIQSSPRVATVVRAGGVLPLSNVSNVLVVECNEGPGYLQFRSDEFGFNNPPGLSRGPIDVAVIGESTAVGHCVPPGSSTVDRLRAHFPRTANFGVAGARTLSQVAVFREYVEPLEPDVVVWFLNLGFAEAEHEEEVPLLLDYLDNPAFSQGLRERQTEVDAVLREVAFPLNERRDHEIAQQLEAGNPFPFARVAKLRTVRDLIDFAPKTDRALEPLDLSNFKRAVALVADTARRWGGRVVVVILPSYELAEGRPADVARYEAVPHAIDQALVSVVDGPAVFAMHHDVESLFTLRISNHPNEQGHALLAEAIVDEIRRARP